MIHTHAPTLSNRTWSNIFLGACNVVIELDSANFNLMKSKTFHRFLFYPPIMHASVNSMYSSHIYT